MKLIAGQSEEVRQRQAAIARLQELAGRGSISEEVRERCYRSIANLRSVIFALRGGHE